MSSGENFKFDPNLIAFALTTFYPKWYRGKLRSIKHTDKVRGDLALEFMQKAKKQGFQVVVSDAKSSKTFRKELSNISGLKIYTRRAMKRSPGRRQAFKIASKINDVQVIISTEAEKISLLDYVYKIVKPILENEADIVVPARDEELFKQTYPGYMYQSEIEGNRLYNEILKLNNFLFSKEEDLDMFFGPRVIRNDKKILSLFMKKYVFHIGKFVLPAEYLNPEQGSDTSFFPVILALKKGFKVKSVKISFSYPPIQKENEEVGVRELFMEKRRNQRIGLLIELMHFINYLEKGRKSGVKSI